MEPKDLSLRQLRAELKSMKLSPSGLKATLVARLKSALSKEGKESIPLTALKLKKKSQAEKIMAALRVHVKKKKELESSDNFMRSSGQWNGDQTAPDTNSKGSVQGDLAPVSNGRTLKPPFQKRKADMGDGEGDREPKRKRLRKKKMPANAVGIPRKKHTVMTESQKFFQDAFLELQRVRMENSNRETLEELQNKVETLRKQTEEKDLLIQALRECITEKDKLIDSITESTAIPKELAMNWAVFQNSMTL